MTLVEWLAGWAVLIAAVASLVVAARGLRQRLTPDWRGPTAVLATVILGLSLLVGVGQLLGTFGWFERGPVLIVLVTLAIVFRIRPRPAGRPSSGNGTGLPGGPSDPTSTADGQRGRQGVADLSAAARRFSLGRSPQTASPFGLADPVSDPNQDPATVAVGRTTDRDPRPVTAVRADGATDERLGSDQPQSRFGPHRDLDEASADDPRGRHGPLGRLLVPTDGWGWVTRLALLAGLVPLTGTWLARTLAAYRHGVADGDSLMYHLPFATHFVQSGDVAAIPSVSPHPWVNFYPANVELIQASAMLPFRHVALVPLLNLGWLALGLLAGWCLGARRDRGPWGLLLAAMLLSLPVMLPTQAGTARVDVAVTGLLLATVVLLLHEPGRAGACLVAGLAAGLAVGTKFAVLPAVGLLLVTAAVVLWWRHGRGQAAAWVAGVALPSAFWLVRNWAVSGSPLPMVDLRLGAVGIDPPEDPRFDLLDGTSIVDQLRHTSDVTRVTMQPAITYAFGSQAFAVVLLVAGVVGAGLVLLRRPIGLPHAVAVTALGACVAYFFSPNTAPIVGFELHQNAAAIVGLNARYLVPGVLLLLSLLPLGLAVGWRRVSALFTAGTAVALVYFATRWHEADREWRLADSDVVAGFALAALLAIVVAVGVVIATRSRSDLATDLATPRPEAQQVRASSGGRASSVYWAAVGSLVVVALVAGGWNVVQSERLNVYQGAEPDVVGLWGVVQDLPSGQRVAVVGEWLQQPYARDDLGNEVEYLGLPQDDGLFLEPSSCREMRQALRDGDYDLVAIQRGVLSFGDLGDQRQWVTSIPGSNVLAENPTGIVVELPATIAPTCDRRGAAR